MPALVQHPAPAFSGTVVEGGLFKQISLKDFEGKWVVLLFYPMDFTFVCPSEPFFQSTRFELEIKTPPFLPFQAEILAFNKALPEFAAINATVIGCSTDSEYSHLAWANLPQSEGGLGPNLKLPLLADRSHKIARDYGVLIEDEGITLRGLFIIDPTGKLRQSTVNDLPVGRSVEETIRLIKAFQYVEIHGEGCPANWKDGAATIKLDPKGKLEWFEKNLSADAALSNGHAKSAKRAAEDIEMNGNDGAKKTKV